MTAGGPLARLSALLVSAIATRPPAPSVGPPIAVGWATVELDRAVAELGSALTHPSERFIEATVSAILGARCLVADGALPDNVALAVLEPNTEGRLAATLARLDEGPAVLWFWVEHLGDAVASPDAPEVRASLPQPGPFGLERLVLDGPIHGPHRLLVERPGTIQT